MSNLDYAPIDNRFASPARQAAKALGVSIRRRPTWESAAVCDRLRWYAEAYETADGRILVVSADALGLSAAVIDEMPRPVLTWMDRDDMRELCAVTGVRDSFELHEARDDIEHCRVGLAA